MSDTDDLIEAMLTRYGEALRSLARGVTPAESDIGPAIDIIRAELVRLRVECEEWKANHDNQVFLRRLITARSDMPADRVALGEQINRLENRAVEAEAKAAEMGEALDRIADLFNSRTGMTPEEIVQMVASAVE